jgi:drug/metabolite transporter (DMT)-like permease
LGALVTPEVFFAVLAAAAMHAGWNSVIKAGSDPLVTTTHLTLFSGAIALCCLPFVAVPQPSVWKWIALSVAVHVVYRLMVVGAYRHGDLAQVYPIMRGTAPMLTAVASVLLIGEWIGVTGFIAVATLSTGVFLISLRGGRVAALNRSGVMFAIVAAICTCAYTLADGIGARENGSGPSYALWLAVCNSIASQVAGVWFGGRSVYATLRSNALASLGGGAMMMGSYFVAIWAMTQAPIALVAALRESSVLFGAIIAAVFLKEPVTRWRVVALSLIFAGMVLLRVA